MTDRQQAYAAWIEAKATEAAATEQRRLIEDWLISEYGIFSDAEGTVSQEDEGFKIKVTSRLTRKVDADKLKELADENGIDTSNLIRWKPELSLTAWKNAAHEITDILAPAITVTPGRPTFAIERNE